MQHNVQVSKIGLLIFFVFSSVTVYGVPIKEGTPIFHVATIAGGKKGYTDGSRAIARFNWPTGAWVNNDGVVFVADYFNGVIRKIDTNGNVTTFAGDKKGFKDGTGKDALFNGPDNIAMDREGNLYVGDADNFSIRKITPGGVVTTIAGVGITGYKDGAGKEAMFGYPTGVAIDEHGVLYVADRRTHTVRKITPDGMVSTLAGNGAAGFIDGKGVNARFNEPISAAVDNDGIVYVADSGNNAIRKINPDGMVSTIAGRGVNGYRDGAGEDALFSWPTGIAIGKDGNVYVCDSNNNKIRKVTPEGVTSTVAGGFIAGFSNGPALTSSFNFPTGIAVDKYNNIYIADSGNNAIRKITYGKEVQTGLEIWIRSATRNKEMQ